MTEIDAGTDTALTAALTNGHSDESPVEAPISNADLGDSAANAAAENQWDLGNDLAASQEWVDVKVPIESPQAETAPSAPTATITTTTPSWADDHPVPSPSEVRQSANRSEIPGHADQSKTQAATPAPVAAADPNDGFQSVQRRGGNNRDGVSRGHRGRGRGGLGRGDGYRGRGRGGPRGGARGGPRRDTVEASS